MKSPVRIMAAALLLPLSCLADTPAKKGPKYDPGIEVGQDARGLRFPVFNEAGILQMYFVIEVATRIDINHMEMSSVQLQTFTNGKDPEMKIDMKNAVLDLNTRVVTTNEPVLIRRSDFVLSGSGALYNSATGDSKVQGKVRMEILDGGFGLTGRTGS
jgi:hypothetical protein